MHCQPFNRTAYGIEITVGSYQKRRLRAFNRTAYGIEMFKEEVSDKEEKLLIAPLMELKFASIILIPQDNLSFNRTAYGIEIMQYHDFAQQK